MDMSGACSQMKRSSKISEAIAREILQHICDARLEVGSQLPGEAQMLEEFDVGRGSLREALRILEVHGVIKIKAGPRGGPVVVGPKTNDYGRMATLFFQAGSMTFREVIDARLMLEPMMARLAAERGHSDLIEQLEMTRTETDTDQSYLRTSESFHRLVGSMSENRVLNLMCHAMEDIFHERVSGLLFPRERRGDVVKAHAAIASAIRNRDGALAEKLMRDHMAEYAHYVEARHPALMDEIVQWR